MKTLRFLCSPITRYIRWHRYLKIERRLFEADTRLPMYIPNKRWS